MRGCTIAAIVIFSVSSIILIGTLVGLSVKKVNNGEYAIVYHDVSNQFDATILEEGRHVLTPDNHLFKFTKKFVTNDDPVQCLSSDGLYISVIPVIQYQFNKTTLYDAFRNLGEQSKIKRYINSIIETAVLDACSLFTAENFYTNRGDVEREISEQFTRKLENAKIPGASPGFVQLKNFQLPQVLLSSIEKAQLALEDVGVAMTERQEKLIVAETAQIQEIQNNQIKLLNGRTLANSILYKAEEQVFARSNLWAGMSSAFLSDMNGLNLTADEYVTFFLLPKATMNVLTDKTRACLTNCGGGENCWFCWVNNAIPAVGV